MCITRVLLSHCDARHRAILSGRALLGLENGKLRCTQLEVEFNTYVGLFLPTAVLVVVRDEFGVGSCDRFDTVVVVLLVVMNVLMFLVIVVVVMVESVEEVNVADDADADVVDDDTNADVEVELELVVELARGATLVVPFLCVYGEDAPAALEQVVPEHFWYIDSLFASPQNSDLSPAHGMLQPPISPG